MKTRWVGWLLVFALAAATMVGLAGPAAAASPGSRIGDAVQVLREMSGKSDVTAMARLVREARGVAIFPTVLKAGLGLGGRFGEGLLLRRDAQTGQWSGPYFIELKGVSYGPQVGVQSTALVLVISNEQGMKGFTGDKVTLGGELSVAAGPVGRQAGAATDVDLKASIYSYSISKGLFAGASLEGSVIQADEKANRDYWGAALTADQMLARPAGEAAASLVKELGVLLAKAK